MTKKLSLTFLEEKARIITKDALSECIFPKDFSKENIFLEMQINEDSRVFELYYSGNNENEKDTLISRTKMNIYTGDGEVETFLPKK